MNILFFDGHCLLCNKLIDWLMQNTRAHELKFASLQGESAKIFLKGTPYIENINTLIYLKHNQKYEKSTAILMLLADMGGPWQFTRIFFLLPKIIRDFIYHLVAKNRYHFFKKRSTCRIPTIQEQKRFLS